MYGFIAITIVLTLLVACQNGNSDNEVKKETQSGGEMQEIAPVNVLEWHAASQMLGRAAELVQERGFQQGATTPVAKECVATALEHAFEEGDYSIVDFNYAREALAQTINVPRDPVELTGDELDLPYWGRDFMMWNDAPGRTQEEVINAFRTAATKAMRFKEAALTKASQVQP